MKKALLVLIVCISAVSAAYSQKPHSVIDSMLVLGYPYSDSINKTELLKIDSLGIWDTINWDKVWTVTSYKIIFQAHGRYTQFASVIGSRLSDKAYNILRNVRKGDVIMIGGIYFIDPEGRVVKFNHPVRLYVR